MAFIKWCWLGLVSQSGGFCDVLAFFWFNYPVWKCTFEHKTPLSANLTGGPWGLGQRGSVLTPWTGLCLRCCKPPLPPSPLSPTTHCCQLPCKGGFAGGTYPTENALFSLPFRVSSVTSRWPDVSQWAAVRSRGERAVRSADRAGSETASPQEARSKLDPSWLWNTRPNFGFYF